MTPRPAAALSAFVLHRWDWSETSLIVDLLTRERGRIAVVAKGAKRPSSNFRAVLLPFNRLVVQLGRAPADPDAELIALRGADWAGGEPFGGGPALFAAFHLNELLLALLPRQDPHPRLFDAYAAVLPLLAADDEGSRRAALRAFELMLLRELGWLPELTRQTQTMMPLEPASRYALSAEFGVVRDPHGVAGSTLLQLAAASGRGLAALHDACLAEPAALKAQLQALLHYHLGGAALRTRRVLHGLQQLLDAPTR